MSALVAEALRALRQVEDRRIGPHATRCVERARELLRRELAERQAEASRAEDEGAAAASARRQPAPPDYPVGEVRRWARAQGMDVPTHGGHLPADVVAAWRVARAVAS